MEKKPKEFTPSQKLRFAFQKLYESIPANSRVRTFDEYYSMQMNDIIEGIENSIPKPPELTIADAPHSGSDEKQEHNESSPY